MNSASGSSLSSVPNGRIIDFEQAELRKLPFQDGLYLWVKGKLPSTGYEARLAPRIYHDHPEYWGIEVTIIEAQPKKLPVAANQTDNDSGADELSFERSVPLTGIMGLRGIAVIGANQVKRIEVSGES